MGLFFYNSVMLGTDTGSLTYGYATTVFVHHGTAVEMARLCTGSDEQSHLSR